MAVNLNGIDLSGAAASSAKKASSTQTAPSSSKDATQQSATSNVSITSTASLLANLQQSLAAKPAVDSDRVAAVSQALAAGTYQINPDKIASGLIASERTLGRLNKQ